MRSARLISSAVIIALSLGGTSWGKTPKVEYSVTQQAAAVSAVTEASRDLDQTEQRLLLIYGDAPTSVRLQEIKDTDAVTHPPVESPAQLLKRSGNALVRHVASLEPLLGACNLNGESVFALSALSKSLSQLLVNRKAATVTEVSDWTEAGGAEGSQRLQSLAELSCPTVRKAFTSATSLLQDAYTRIEQVAGEQPSADAPGSSSAPSAKVASR